MHWVLQANMFNEAGFQRLLDALARLSIPHTLHKVIPFVGVLSPPLTREEDGSFPQVEFDENTAFPMPDGPKIVMGSYSMANYARKKGWTPGSFDSINLDFEAQYPHWGNEMLNSDALVVPFRAVPRQKHEFFIRPTLDSKSFAGVVMGWPEFQEWQATVLLIGADNGGTLDGDTLVMVCPKKVIFREYRLWVVNRKIVTASLYKEGRTVRYSDMVDEGVLRYAEQFLTPDAWVPADAFVLDIAETPDGYRILEAGCLNAAGFYAADMQKLVMALEDAFAEEGSNPSP